MSCSTCPPEACFNGCVDITADACVRYTGNDSEELDISTGDSLLTVENILIEKVVSFLDGTGIDITINPSYYCTLVSQYLPVGTPNLVEVLSALVRAACNLQVQVDAVEAELAILNADYDVDCLSGVTDSSDTHAVLQAVITKLCVVEADLAALTLDVDTNYVKLADLDALIAAYLASQSGAPTQQSSKMVPFVAYEYYGSFPVGIGLAPAVNPANPGNPNYALTGTTGANTVTLTPTQLPAHTHTALGTTVVTLNDPGHTHAIGQSGVTGGGGTIAVGNTSPKDIQAISNTTGITVTSNTANNVAITVDPTGDNVAHSNIQPVIAAYYIMYIP